ncbi:MAG: glycosyltransferase, partial [Actinomycetota bacterium]|nr:glycosyltransferase [Actinomycetota bacterium]
MRITYCVHQFFPFFYTGTERVTLNLAKQMQRMGHSVQVLSYGTGDNPADYAPLTPRVNWREYSHEGVPVVSLLHTMQPEGFGFAAQNDAIQEASTELLRRYSTDVVHVMHPMRIPSAAQVARE